MLDMIEDKYGEFDIKKINSIIVIISFILFIISLIFIKNVYLIIILYLLLLYLSKFYDKKIIKFICSILPIIILGYFLFHFINYNFIKNESYRVFRIIIKILFCLDYVVILYNYFKDNKFSINSLFKKKKIYTFKELRRLNINKYRKNVDNYIEDYLKENNISLDSDYFKLIDKNREKKSTLELEEFVWMNYLRFYKHKSDTGKINLGFYDLLFLVVHVIILLLVLVVR